MTMLLLVTHTNRRALMTTGSAWATASSSLWWDKLLICPSAWCCPLCPPGVDIIPSWCPSRIWDFFPTNSGSANALVRITFESLWLLVVIANVSTFTVAIPQLATSWSQPPATRASNGHWYHCLKADGTNILPDLVSEFVPQSLVRPESDQPKITNTAIAILCKVFNFTNASTVPKFIHSSRLAERVWICNKVIMDRWRRRTNSTWTHGTLFRNGPGLLEVVTIHHPFDGDGMISAIAFRDGRSFPQPLCPHRSVFRRTKAGKILYRGVFGTQKPGGWLAMPSILRLKNIANTNIIYWGGKLLALWSRRPSSSRPSYTRNTGQDSLNGVLSDGDLCRPSAL